ncbi:hypothetical protein AWM68_17260 [Fictibacillus phosphorivorans]|uniref:Uncharacterized protein n=1 Tax=Fictibacillus phosphorivorans TaxID=1221500 RepID=A0A163S0V7_9BACL|nr:hypothetical protein [Fictibacillus phosphorivorans]KZE67922.1 hypothetical protein AWM68_17260 [Fictibacillus phosphorivorans]
MSIIKAYLLNKEQTTGNFAGDYLVSFENLASFLQRFQDNYEIVVVGQSDLQFVLSVKGGVIEYCTLPNELLVKLKNEMKAYNKQSELQLFQVIRNQGVVERINLYSNSATQAREDFNKWSKLSPDKIIQIA